MDKLSKKIAARYERAVQAADEPWALGPAIEILEPEDEPSRTPGGDAWLWLLAGALLAAWVLWIYWMLKELWILG